MESLTRWIEATGKSRADLALELGVRRITIYQYEWGDRLPKPATAKRLSELTGIPLHKIRPDIWDKRA